MPNVVVFAQLVPCNSQVTCPMNPACVLQGHPTFLMHDLKLGSTHVLLRLFFLLSPFQCQCPLKG